MAHHVEELKRAKKDALSREQERIRDEKSARQLKHERVDREAEQVAKSFDHDTFVVKILEYLKEEISKDPHRGEIEVSVSEERRYALKQISEKVGMLVQEKITNEAAEKIFAGVREILGEGGISMRRTRSSTEDSYSCCDGCISGSTYYYLVFSGW